MRLRSWGPEGEPAVETATAPKHSPKPLPRPNDGPWTWTVPRTRGLGHACFGGRRADHHSKGELSRRAADPSLPELRVRYTVLCVSQRPGSHRPRDSWTP